jgi:hypothetical protein
MIPATTNTAAATTATKMIRELERLAEARRAAVGLAPPLGSCERFAILPFSLALSSTTPTAHQYTKENGSVAIDKEPSVPYDGELRCQRDANFDGVQHHSHPKCSRRK